jgi:Flp pilus assembly protein TadG
MRLHHARRRRSGTHVVECAVIYPVVFLLVLGIIVGGLGIFRYQQVAHLSREAARYAAVHGGMYQAENAAAIQAGTLPNVTEGYLTQNIVVANAAAMDTSKLSVKVSFNNPNGSYDWDDTTNNGSRYPFTENAQGTHALTNTVSVTVSYEWVPEFFFGDPITVSSTSVMPMSY